MFEKLKKRLYKDGWQEDEQQPSSGRADAEGAPCPTQEPQETASPGSASLEAQITRIETLFQDVDVVITRRFRNIHDSSLQFCLFYCDGLVNSGSINDFILRPIMLAESVRPGPNLLDDVLRQFIMVGEVEITTDQNKIIQAIGYGDTVLCVDGFTQVIVINSKGFPLRSISEPESEKVLSGPREGFNEGILSNISLIRRRLVTNNLKMKIQMVGRRSQTKVCVCYLDGVVNKKILEEVLGRMKQIDIDGVLDSNYIAEILSPISLLGFNSFGVTERPDIIAGKLLEGRVAILVDGSPAVLTVPYLFIENFQSNEDYYVNRYYATFSRLLRIFAFLFTVSVPALYIAIVTRHHEIIPTDLLISFASERQNVPLPAGLEAFMLLIVFDILRETGIRMPSGIGQSLSIVGALVIGQSAVEAGLVAAPMIIVIAFTGITNLLVPKMAAPALVARYGLLLLATGFGLPGVTAGAAVLLIHVFNLCPLGVDQLLPIEHLTSQRVKDIYVRSSWRKMRTRISPVSDNATRAKYPDKERR